MHRKVLFGDLCGDGHGIENFHEEVVDFLVKSVEHFLPEGEGFRHVARLVVPPQQHHTLGEIQLNRKQQSAHLDAENASVDVVSHEEVVEGAGVSRLGDHVEQVGVLAVDISHDADWFGDAYQVGVALKNRKRF